MTTDTKSRPTITRGRGSDDRPVARTLWDRDSRPAARSLSEHGNHEPDNQQVDYKRYYDEGYFKLEVEKLWLKTWLFACREEDIPKVGDRVPLEVGPLSFFIVRSKEDEFHAFYNSCLHRGTTLCAKLESSGGIRCPYHGWEWNNDGSLKFIPSHWDFMSITRANGSLREVKVARWGGFVFINADPNCAPLKEALQVIPDHFRNFDIENRYTAARFRKLVLANWKVAQEAFMESYHLYATHPEAVPYNGDSQTQYDIWSNEHGHVGRNATPSAVPSMHADSSASPHAAAEVYMAGMQGWHYPNEKLSKLDPDADPRVQAAQWHREVWERAYGRPSPLADAEMIDSLLYFFFPHSTFWLSESLPFTYQFTPHASDPNKSYFEVRMLLPCPKGQPRPASSPAVEISPEERVQDKAPGFNILGYVFDQDMSNMPLIQKGCRAADPSRRHSQLGRYQESIVQYWNALIDQYLSA
jgi:phenylpropionate dioxygenase-like ring-hydroxylating dioxygenase large terminal subunit